MAPLNNTFANFPPEQTKPIPFAAESFFSGGLFGCVILCVTIACPMILGEHVWNILMLLPSKSER